LSRGQGLLAAARGDLAAAESHLGEAIGGFASLGFPYWRATAQTELADLLVSGARAAEASSSLNEACAVFSRVGAAPALHRVEGLLADDAVLQLGRDR
jgi:hypothetical protein